jgi:hypothetical protein
MLKLGLIGKPNVGKSTLFSALTFSPAEIANYPFTTTKPNVGIGYIVATCPHTELGKQCTPREGKCLDGRRFVPLEIIDVPGLIPGASEGKGMGNEFLDYIREADVILHIFDSSGKVDSEGNPSSDTLPQWDDIISIEEEMVAWLSSRIFRDWEKFSRKADSTGERLDRSLHEKLASYGISDQQTSALVTSIELPRKLSSWKLEDVNLLVREIFRTVKPIFRIGNRSDISSKEILESLRNRDSQISFVSGGYELLMEKAEKNGIIEFASDRAEITSRATASQRKALEEMLNLYRNGFTELSRDVLGRIVFESLGYSVVYPVSDDSSWSDSKGNVLPDAILVPKGTTALELAFKVHTDIGQGFIRAIDCRKKMAIRKDHTLSMGDVVRIVAKTQ